jgi:glutaredoxin-related protein
MLKVVGSHLCPDTLGAIEQLKKEGKDFEFIDILNSHEELKVYLALRDADPLYKEIRGTERMGIPCFIKDDGAKTLDIAEV